LIDSVTELELAAAAWPVFDIAASAMFYPFHYTDDDWIDLRGLAIQQYPDPAGQLRGWARAFVRYGHAFPAQRSQRGRLGMHCLSKPRG
jgi:hypothetical protein